MFSVVSKISKTHILFTSLFDDWKNNKIWLINKLRKNFNTWEKLGLNNTSMSLHFYEMSKFNFLRNSNVLKEFLFILKCSRCDCIRTINRWCHFQQIFFSICLIMKAFFSSLTSISDSFSNSFESNCFIKIDGKFIFWRITFKILYWTLIKQFNWIWIFIIRFFNFNLFANSLWVYHARMFANRICSLNINCEFSIIIFFWKNSLNENQQTINSFIISH